MPIDDTDRAYQEELAQIEYEEKWGKCIHDWKYEDDEYGSLGSGGSYAIYRCTKCDKREYEQLPD